MRVCERLFVYAGFRSHADGACGRPESPTLSAQLSDRNVTTLNAFPACRFV